MSYANRFFDMVGQVQAATYRPRSTCGHASAVKAFIGQRLAAKRATLSDTSKQLVTKGMQPLTPLQELALNRLKEEFEANPLMYYSAGQLGYRVPTLSALVTRGLVNVEYDKSAKPVYRLKG